jgi:5-methylcytosine-specific restriction endonuclease McrA
MLNLGEDKCECGYDFEDLKERLGLHDPRERYGIAQYQCICKKWYEVDALSDEISLLPIASNDVCDNLAFPFDGEPTKRESISPSERFKIMERDGFRCRLCGATAKHRARLEVDHKVPVAKGGSNDPSNLWTLCFTCNRGKRDKNMDA